MTPKTTKKGRMAAADRDVEKDDQKIVNDDSGVVPDYQPLVQPPPFRMVETFTTYSAYEDPI